MAAALKVEINALVAQISDKKKAQEALEGIAKIASEKGSIASPFLLPEAFEKVIEAIGDKSKAVKEAAVGASMAIVEILSPYAIEIIMPAILGGLAVKAKPPQKEAVLKIITQIAAKAPNQLVTSL